MGLKGAEAVLQLRALYASGDFPEYWAYHAKCELQSVLQRLKICRWRLA